MIQPTPDVLAVDDDEITRSIVCRVLHSSGVSAAACADGSEMWKALGRFTPKVVILDVEMPGEDGFLLAERLRARYGLNLSIIMLTSHDMAADMAVGMQAGADDYLVKPCDWQHLIAAVRRYVH